MTAPPDRPATEIGQPIRRLERDGFRLGRWTVEPRRNLIASDQVEQRVDPRSMEVLVLLAARAGDVVTRDELNDAVWADAFVSDNTVSQAVSRLRKALGDRQKQPRFIETISKSGYRLLAEVHPPSSASAAQIARSGAPGLTSVHSHRNSEPDLSDASTRFHSNAPLIWLGLTSVAALAMTLAFASSNRRSTDAAPGPEISVVPEVTLVGSQFDSVLSPSGDRIAFSWRPDDASPWNVWLQDVGGDNPVRLTDHAMWERLPAWSPDGSALAYALFSQETGPEGIYRTSLISGATERLGDCPLGLRAIAWSPAGDSLALGISGDHGAPSRLEIMDLASGLRRRLTSPVDGTIGDRGPVFSPDGRAIVFERRRSSWRHDVMLIDLASGETSALTDDAWGQLRGVEWSADGSHVIYASNRSGQFRLWQVPAAGGDSTRLPVEDVWVTQPSVSRSGGRLIYRTFRDVVDVWALTLGKDGVLAGEPVRKVASTRSERHPAWSPDGRRIAFASDRSGSVEIWTGPVDGVAAMRHTQFSGPIPNAPTWSPDGGRLVFDAAVDGHSDLWIVRVDSRRPERLTTDESEDRNGFFSRDGQWIYFTSDRSGSWQVWRMPASGSAPSKVTTDGAFLAQESPDGRSLYFAKLDEPGIWRTPPQGGPAEVVLEELSLSDWGNWVVGRDGIYFVQRDPTTLRFLDFASGEVRTAFAPSKQVPFLERSLSLSPDGRSLLLALIDHSDDEILRVDMAGL